MLEEYVKKNYPNILEEYQRSKKTFEELFKKGDLVECIDYDLRENIVSRWSLYFVKKVLEGEDSGNGIPWGDSYYVFDDGKKRGRCNLIKVDSEWWKVLRKRKI